MTTETQTVEFLAWPKIARLNREVIITEKIDGTNAAIGILEDGRVYAQSRKRIITPEADNFGFAAWVYENSEELAAQLGPGLHFGEWWGSGIQRGYGLPKGEKRFSLFNALRWTAHEDIEFQCFEAPLCYVVPIVETSNGFDMVDHAVERLRRHGSIAGVGFDNPEGVVAYHKHSNTSFKVTIENDDEWKGKRA